MNSVILIGRLVRDPELRVTQSGLPVARMRIAVDRARPNPQTGNREADFIDIVVWGKQAETVSQYLRKGRLVAVDGRLQVRNYENPDGQKRTFYEVVAERVQFLDKASGPVDAPHGNVVDDPVPFASDDFAPDTGDTFGDQIGPSWDPVS
ncbi:MAG: Single-stranded DNA-binding protein ssb [Firmicutes bacterium ADurb.Bin506]|jgi:single-strand DNA-binding protein|nr:MAG: Single-stranded DNA-binding protein ssb [Firmicutes bacterium ADurb.Bin506]